MFNTTYKPYAYFTKSVLISGLSLKSYINSDNGWDGHVIIADDKHLSYNELLEYYNLSTEDILDALIAMFVDCDNHLLSLGKNAVYKKVIKFYRNKLTSL